MQEERLEAEHSSSTSYSEPGPAAPGAQIDLNISGEEAFARRARQALDFTGVWCMQGHYEGPPWDQDEVSTAMHHLLIVPLQDVQGTLWILSGARARRPGRPS